MTFTDCVFLKIINLVESNKRPSEEHKIPGVYTNIWNELSVIDGVLLRHERLVIPSNMQSRIVKLGHEGHLGMVNTKRLLRSKFWFPNLDKMVEIEVKSCLACQATVYKKGREPLSMSPLPNGPWESIKADFYGPLPSGEYLLLIIDEYSRWVEVEITKTIKAQTIIALLDKVFSCYGIPYKVTTDNGPPFQSNELKRFFNYMGITHRRITPLWPQANAQPENFNRMLRKTIQ